MDKRMKQIVISAVNLRKGGTLTILRQCLAFLSEWAPVHGYQVTALVHKRELADYPHIHYIELPWAIEISGSPFMIQLLGCRRSVRRSIVRLRSPS